MNEEIIVNGKVVTQEEFIQIKESVEKTKDQQLVEVAPNCYKTRMFG
jgi:folylpolyglutamate synthase/dihydropteroate synthase